VIVMAGVPSIMQAMFDEVAPKLKIGVRILSETVRTCARATLECNSVRSQGQSWGRDRELSVLRSTARAQHECGAARPRCREARAGQTCGRGDAGASAASTIKGCLHLSTSGGQEFESVRARHEINDLAHHDLPRKAPG
jgi:hypothetical protein